jgi:2-polyprenyl-3-methyl-5-hydroxy-6-metoxy-1,4-benzoquinol methylase
MREVLACPLCHSTQLETALTCKDFTVSGELFPIKKCTNCHFQITATTPDILDLPRYYQSNDYISHASSATTIINTIYLRVRTYTLRWKEQLATELIAKTADKTILDYGCGTGEFLKKCKSLGWNVAGVEPAEDARKKAQNNCNQHIAPSIDDLATKDFTVITLWHVLEHIPDLNETIALLREKLNPSGKIIIALPNPNSWDAQHYKNFWAAYDVPRHLWHFTQSNLELLLRNHHFVLKRQVPMKLDAYYVSLLSEKYRNNGKTTLIGILRALYNGTKSNLRARKTGEYSSIIYIANK